MAWPPVPASGQRQKANSCGWSKGGWSRAVLSLKATMPSETTWRHCLPCLKPDDTRTYQATQTTCPGANLTASSTCQWAGVRLVVLTRGGRARRLKPGRTYRQLPCLYCPLSDHNNKDNISTAASSVTALFVYFVHRHVASFCGQGTRVESWQTVLLIRGSVGRRARCPVCKGFCDSSALSWR